MREIPLLLRHSAPMRGDYTVFVPHSPNDYGVLYGVFSVRVEKNYNNNKVYYEIHTNKEEDLLQ